MIVSGVRARVLLVLLMLVASTVTAVFHFDTSYAAQITSRSVTLQKHAGQTTGGSAPSGVADHKFSFTIPTNTSIGSIGFQYCTAATGTCTMPAGLVTTSATVSGLSANISAWTLTNTTNGAPYITHSATAVTGATTATLQNITNPTATNTTFFVRITTYTGTDGATGATDAGNVAASTANTITVTGTMPEYLQFCTGGAITVTSNIPNCGSATAGSITFNQTFSPSSTSVANSMMAAATNAGSGYAITVTGTTLTSGSNTIPTIGTSAVAANTTVGTSEFGINLVANTTLTFNPAPGANINPASNASTLRGNPTAAYSTADSYALDLTGATSIANSDNTTPGTAAPTNSQAYTVTYIANVSGIQAPGTYVATINYICTPTF